MLFFHIHAAIESNTDILDLFVSCIAQQVVSSKQVERYLFSMNFECHLIYFEKKTQTNFIGNFKCDC